MAFWYSTPLWLPHTISALLPDNTTLISVDADVPRRNSWTIHTLHLSVTATETTPSAATQPTEIYDLLRRGPLDDLNALLARYQITIQRLIVTQGDTRWLGSAQFGKGRFTTHLSGELDSHSTLLSADINLDTRNLDGEISIGDQIQMKVSIKPSTSTLDGGLESRLEFSLDAAITDLWIEDGQPMQFGVPASNRNAPESVSATSAELQIQGALSFEQQSYTLTLDQNSHGLAQNLSGSGFTIPRFRAALRAPATLTLSDQELLLAPLRFTSNNLQISYDGTELPRFRVTGDVSLHNNIASGTVHVASRVSELSEQITISVPFSHQIDTGVGRGTVHSQAIRFSEQQRFLPSIIPNWRWPADLIAGSISLSGQLHWTRSDSAAKINVKLNKLDSFYREILFRGVDGTAMLDWPAARIAVEMSAEQLQAGMEMSNLELSASFVNGNAHIKTAQLVLFDGILSTSNINLDPQSIEFESLIKLRGIELGELLGIEKGIEGSGIIDGQLPVQVIDRTVTINDGELVARKPGGVIRYTGTVPEAVIRSSPELQIAVDALKNFHYKVLDIRASYAENGKMMLAVRLEGRNPEMKNSRPVNFNLNVTEDIPSLINSLMLTREISDGLQQRIEQSQR